jgi:ABC-2 type transport system permease protein
MQRMLAIIERELRRFKRSPTLIVISLVFPLVQLVILGYAFGGTVRHLKLGVVDQDRGLQAVQLRELAGALASGPHVLEPIQYADAGQALADLRNGRINGVLTIPPGFSRRTLTQNDPRVAIIADNTDNFVSNAMAAAVGGMIGAFNGERSARTGQRVSAQATLDVVEVYAFVPYIQYLLPGSIVISIFMMVMVGGGIIFIDDKARGLHEGYLVTPITKLELILGFNLSGAIKAVMAGLAIATVGAVIAGVPNPFEPLRLLRVIVVVVITALALVSMMFLLMVRVTDPLLPRAVFGVLNTLLFFPSGAVYPQQGFPSWMRAIAVVDPFTYAVHAFKCVLLKNTGFGAIAFDLGYLAVFATVAMLLATALFKRSL